MTDLDRLLRAWSDRPTQANLSQIEPQVWALVDTRSRYPVSGMLGFRAALVASMMVLGIIAGGVASATAEPEASPFAVHSVYAPSTLLEGGK